MVGVGESGSQDDRQAALEEQGRRLFATPCRFVIGAAHVDQTPASDENQTEGGKAPQPESPGVGKIEIPPAEATEAQQPFTVQVGVYHDKENANNMASNLTALGYSSFIHESQDNRQRPLYKVCFGRFETKEGARQAVEVFKQEEEKEAFVVRLETR